MGALNQFLLNWSGRIPRAPREWLPRPWPKAERRLQTY